MGYSNEAVIKRFINKKKGKTPNGNVSSDGEKLYSYSLCIARWVNDRLEILRPHDNISPSTRNHLNTLNFVANNNHFIKVYSTINGSGYNRYQFPRENESYSVVVHSTKSIKSIESCINNSNYNKYFGFINFTLEKEYFENSYQFDIHRYNDKLINKEDYFNCYNVIANFHYDSNKICPDCNDCFVCGENCNTCHNFIIPDWFNACDNCNGLGFTLNKNFNEKKCIYCDEGLCLKI